MASPMTWRVSRRNSFSMSIDSPVPLMASSLTQSLSTARVAMAMISSRISTRSALEMCPRIFLHVSPPLVTSPVPRISRKGAYENSRSLRILRLLLITRFMVLGSAMTTQCRVKICTAPALEPSPWTTARTGPTCRGSCPPP